MFKVVVIDDEAWVRSLIVDLIPWKEMDMVVMGEAEDGFKALLLCRTIRPHIVITDIRMPGMDGTELLKRLEKDFPETELIIISGHDEFAYAKKAIEAGALDYVLKPVDEDELVRVLLKAKERIQSRREMRQKMQKLTRGAQKLQDLLDREQEEPAFHDDTDYRIKKALRIIQQEYNSDLALEDVAERVYMAHTYFSHMFKKHIGRGFVEYLNDLRIEKAKQLLRNRQLKVSEIAVLTGFNDLNYFCRVFKKRTGFTPSVFADGENQNNIQ